MFAEISPKCWKVLNVGGSHPRGSRVGLGLHKRTKALVAAPKKEKKPRRQKNREEE